MIECEFCPRRGTENLLRLDEMEFNGMICDHHISEFADLCYGNFWTPAVGECIFTSCTETANYAIGDTEMRSPGIGSATRTSQKVQRSAALMCQNHFEQMTT